MTNAFIEKPCFRAVHVSARRWFNKREGNTYHSVRVLIDGEERVNVDFAYGYGNHYTQTAVEETEKHNILPGLEHFSWGGCESLRHYCQRHDAIYTEEVVDVDRKRDL